LLGVYNAALSNALKPSSDTEVGVDTVLKVRELASSLDYLGTVTLHLGFSLQSWDNNSLA